MGSFVCRGSVDDGFGPVADAFRKNFEQHGELGASLCVYVGTQCVIDIAAGISEQEWQLPFQRDTLATVFSATKGLVAMCFLKLEDEGGINLDQPIAEFWPQFAKHGKAHITTRHILNHRAGLSALDMPLTLEDFQDPARIDTAICEMRPMWLPGLDQGYSATSFGATTQAIFRRVTGTTLGAWLAEHITGPLGADVFLGTPDTEHARMATTYGATPAMIARWVLPRLASASSLEGQVYRQVLFGKGSDTHRAFTNPTMKPGRFARLNEPAIRRMELPWMNAACTARGLARAYAPFANDGSFCGTRIVSAQAIQRVTSRQSWSEHDRVLHKPLGFSQGFLKEQPHLFSPHEAAFGHSGAGGALGFADPTHRVAFGYVLNQMHPFVRSPRAIALCRSLYTVLGDS